MINVSKIKPGTLLRLQESPRLISYSSDEFLGEYITEAKGLIVTFLEFKEGVEIFAIKSKLSHKDLVYMVKVLVLSGHRKMWMAVSIQKSHVTNLPDDMLDALRETKMFDIVSEID